MTTEARPQQETKEIPQEKIPVLVAGLPGKMATLIAEGVEGTSAEFELLHIGLSSERNSLNPTPLHAGKRLRTLKTYVGMWGPRDHLLALSEAKNTFAPNVIAVDYTTPDTVNRNAQLYAEAGIPFVMGTSGGDRKQLEETVRNSGISAVIAANMDPQVVARRMEIDDLAQSQPGIFEGARIEITESHQKTKKDISGTALALKAQYEGYGSQGVDITSIRDTDEQMALGIPDPDNGHAYHWVKVFAPDGTVVQEFSTKVKG